MKKLIIAVAVLLGMTACTDKSQQMVKLAEMSLRQSVGEGSEVKILGVSEPDSTFGTGYLTRDEKKAVMGTMKKVTDQIMSRTQNMTAFDQTTPMSSVWLSDRCEPTQTCARCSLTVTRKATGADGR